MAAEEAVAQNNRLLLVSEEAAKDAKQALENHSRLLLELQENATAAEQALAHQKEQFAEAERRLISAKLGQEAFVRSELIRWTSLIQRLNDLNEGEDLDRLLGDLVVLAARPISGSRNLSQVVADALVLNLLKEGVPVTRVVHLTEAAQRKGLLRTPEIASNVANRTGGFYSPLTAACFTPGRDAVIDAFLVKLSTSKTFSSDALLYCALALNLRAASRLLLRQAVSIDDVSVYTGQAPLETALFRNDPAAASMLISLGASLTNDDGQDLQAEYPELFRKRRLKFVADKRKLTARELSELSDNQIEGLIESFRGVGEERNL